MSSALAPAISLRSTLVELLDTSLDTHKRNIAARHPPLSDILSGARGLVLYPAARMAAKAAQLLRDRGAKVIGFSDKDEAKWGKTIDGLPVISPKELPRLSPQPAILIASTLHDSSIGEYLRELGCKFIYSTPYLNYSFPEVFVSREYYKATEAPYGEDARAAILHAFDLLSDDESRRVLVGKIRYYLSLEKRELDAIRSKQPIYFDSEIVRARPDHIVVDGGAFNGDTLRQFRTLSSNQFRKYYAFEPDGIAFSKLEKEAEEYYRVEVICAGLSNRTASLRFAATGMADGAIVAGGEGTSIDVISLDSYFAKREPPTFLKMDIEGSEADALMGARGLISAHKPALAISAYHHPSDLWEIPALIFELAPAHRIYLRHYTREIDDTVYYAIPE